MSEQYRAQHQKRLSYMPWLYYALKPQHKAWALEWQLAYQQQLMVLETVTCAADVFIAPEALLFAEPGRTIAIGEGSFIAADCVLHGPITLGKQVSINHHVTLEGGRVGIIIGDFTRIASYTT